MIGIKKKHGENEMFEDVIGMGHLFRSKTKIILIKLIVVLL